MATPAPRRRIWVLTAVAAALVAVVLGCLFAVFSGAESNNPDAVNAEAGGFGEQQKFQAALQEDRRYLSDGLVIYTGALATEVETSVLLKVHVCGVEDQACSGLPDAPRAGDGTRTETTAIGARISAALTTDMPGQVEVLSSAVQPVIAKTDKADWIWRLTPAEPGDFHAEIRLSALRGDTDVALMPDQVLPVTLASASTPGYRANAIWQGFTDAATSIGGLLSAFGLSIVTVVTYVVRRLRRRRAATGGTAASADASDGNPVAPAQRTSPADADSVSP